jgi:hypothetical protein
MNRKIAGRASARITLIFTLLLTMVAPFVLHQVRMAQAQLPAPTVNASLIANPIPDAIATGSISGSVTLGPIALAGYNSCSFTIPVGTWSAGNIQLQASFDGGTTYSNCGYIAYSSGSGSNNYQSISGTLSFGSLTGSVIILPGTTHVKLVASAITGTTGTAVLKATISTSPIVIVAGNNGATIGAVNANLQSSSAAIGHFNGATYTHISTATTTTAKSGSGILHELVVNTAAALATITIYDNTAGSGTVIAVYTMPTTLLQSSFSTGSIDVAFSTGCTIVTTGTQDITVSTY